MNYEVMTDIELVNLAQSGNGEAMDILVERYKNFVRGKGRTYFLIGADKEDIIQEGMIGLFKAIRDFDATKQAQFRSFAELCVTRQIITAIKSATRQKHIPLNTYVSLSKPVYEDESEKTLIDLISMEYIMDPEQIFINQESLGITEKRINDTLSFFEKSVLELYINGKTYHEIAEMLGKESKSIDNAIQRVKRKISKQLEIAKKEELSSNENNS
ncbi:MAG: RNA polymerase sporulation sigma factor SigH [Clostridia bacterium]|nr:RNA polymerase sporulation sigma factor SigH [Clostridia bacterium]